MKIIDFENHFFTQSYLDYLKQRRNTPRIVVDKGEPVLWYNETMSSPRTIDNEKKHLEVGDKRIRDMDEAGIDIEVLSVAPPGIQRFEPDQGSIWARKLNDELAEIVKKHPTRFVGLACIAPQEPQNAALELERSVNQLGFKGVILHSHAGNEYLDGKKHRIIFETAARLNVPVYVHPELPSSLILPGFEDYGFKLASTTLGFAVDVVLHSMRLICSGLFDELPQLQIVLGHLGEGLPFWLQRMDGYVSAASGPGPRYVKLQKKPSDYVKNNFTVLTSGMHFLPSFTCAHMALGADRIAFGTDFPYGPGLRPPVDFMKGLAIPDADKEKILYSNIARLLKI